MLSTAYLALLVTLACSNTVHAWFRVACTDPLVTERVDPIISPNITYPSNHVHTVHGASGFSSNSNYESLRMSSCTNCEVSQDLSNYWFPKLYFHDPVNGGYEEVANGGLLVYYLNRGNGDVSNGGSGLIAFPPGFKMISGNPVRRSRQYTPLSGGQGELAERAIQWTCLRYTSSTAGYDNTLTWAGFPNTTCEAGFQGRIQFPTCWDGVNLDSPDHTTHTAYLDQLDNGVCPDDHPVYLMHLFYEITWDVDDFSDRWDQSTGAWPFVWSTGDPTGFSLHGDFQNGWDVTALQNAISGCNNPNNATGSGDTSACPWLTVIDASVANECKISPIFSEQTGGNLTHLPGCNPLQTGPQNATLYSDSDCPAH